MLSLDEHVWRHTRRGDKNVTVILDLPPVRDRTGPAQLLDVIEDRSRKTLKTWLATRGSSWREQVEVVAMDGFTGLKSATGEELPRPRRSRIPSTSCPWPPTTSTSAATASYERSQGGGAGRATRSTGPGAPY